MPEGSGINHHSAIDAGHLIASASAGRALRALRVGVAHTHHGASDPADDSQLGLQRMQSSLRILLEPPEDMAIMGPSYPTQSFLCCFSRAEESSAFRQDVRTRGWSAALSLHAEQLFQMLTLSTDASYSSTVTHQSKQLLTRKHHEVCFMHCLLVPKSSFQIPASKMRLSEDALASASHIHSHKSAGDFLQAFHSHVSQGLYHLGGIFFHELTIRSEEESTFQNFQEAFSRQFSASFGLSVPLIGGGAVSGGRNVGHTSDSGVRSFLTVQTIKEEIICLGPTSPVIDAVDFQRKLDEDPLSWVIIEKETDCADTLVSVWEIILAQPAAPICSSSEYNPELLKQAAIYMSNHWQDEVSSWPGTLLNPLLSDLLSRNSEWMRLTAGHPQTAANMPPRLQPGSSFRIRPLPQKIPLIELPEQLQNLISPDHLAADAEGSSAAAAQVVKSCISQLLSVASPAMIPDSDQKMLEIIMGYGFDSSGNLLYPLSPLQFKSLIDELQKCQIREAPVGTQPLPANYDSWQADRAAFRGASDDLWPEVILGSNALIKYDGDVVVDRPFLQRTTISSDCTGADGLIAQARRLFDCVRHRINPLQHLSHIRGEDLVSVSSSCDSWDDEAKEEHDADTPAHVSLFELLIEFLKSSDLPSQVALFKLLLEQRSAVPLVHPDTAASRKASQKLQAPLKHYAQALSFVQVKLPEEEKVYITEDVQLPRVVFLSKKEVCESGAAIVASKVLSCSFMSQYNRADMDCMDAPVVEVGLGFVRPGEGQSPASPCLAVHINGRWEDPSVITSFVYDVADVIILELHSWEDSEGRPNPPPSSRPIQVLQWVHATRERVDTKRNVVSGGESYVVNKTEKFLRSALGKVKVQNRQETLAETLTSHFSPHGLLSYEQEELKLRQCDFSKAKHGLPLQDSFSREARIQFEILKLKHSPAESRRNENSCKKEQELRKSKVEEVIRNPLMQLFQSLLSRRDSTSRRVGMMWLERALTEKMQPLMREAAEAKDISFKEWQKDLSSVHLRAQHLRAKQNYVDRTLGIGNLWRELCHIFTSSPKRHRNLATLAARHLLDAFPMEILDGDAGMFCKDWVQTVLAELHVLTAQALHKNRARIFVLSVMGLQSSGKSTLLNLMFGTQLHASAGRCTRGVYIQLVKSERVEYDYVLLLDTEGIRSPEFHGLQDSQIRDNRLATFGLLPADASIFMVSNEDDTGLKEVLPMVLLAFKGSAIAQSYGGRIRAKMVFLYRSVDINDKTKLKENKEKLQEHLRMAAQNVANMGQNNKSSVGSDPEEDHDEEGLLAAAATGKLLQSMFNEGLCVDDDDDKSDVKCMGNLKRGHIPPDDIPEWSYGEQVVKIWEFMHRRVTAEKGWAATGLQEWGNYLSMVWECICKADFDLSFKTAVEVNSYRELQQSLAGGPRLELSKKCMEEFECMERKVRSMKEGDDTSTVHTIFKNRVEEAMKPITAEVRRMLNTSAWKLWKAQENSKWDVFCTSLREDYRRRLDDLISGVLKFDNVVNDYERKMKREIVEQIEAGKLKHDTRDAVFEDIFSRIMQEAQTAHEPFAQSVPNSVKKAYVTMSDLTKKFDLLNQPASPPGQLAVATPHQQSDMDWSNVANASTVAGAVKKLIGFGQSFLQSKRGTPHGRPEVPDRRMHMRSKLDRIVDSQLVNVKKYDELIVINVIEMTTRVLEEYGYSRDEQEEGHRWVMYTLTEKLQKIQQQWDREHNVAERLKEAKPQLRSFFEDCANGVGAATMLISELQRVLEDQLPASHHDLLVRAVVENLGNMNWLINWEAMRACLDLHLLTLIEQKRIEELLMCVENGNSHFLLVLNALIATEIIRLYNKEWQVFFGKVQRCLRDVGQQLGGSSTGKATPASGNDFLAELSNLITYRQVDPKAKLATTMKSRIYLDKQYEYMLDGDFFSTKVPELCDRLQKRFQDQGKAVEAGEASETIISELIKKVSKRMEELKDERVTPRCHEACPLCNITCFRAAGHVERHDTVHQPGGLGGVQRDMTHELVADSCWNSLESGHSFQCGSQERKPYRDFEKVFPTWLNPSNHDTTATQVREYIFYTYQAELAAHFTKTTGERYKICPANKMPPKYATHSLEALYNTLQNRLSDSYATVARTLQNL